MNQLISTHGQVVTNNLPYPCPDCKTMNMRLMKNILHIDGEPVKCIGLPVCFNLECLHISPNIQTLELPLLDPDMIPSPESTVKGKELTTDIYNEFIRYGKDLKAKMGSENFYPDVTAIDWFKNFDAEEFGEMLKSVWKEIPDLG